MEPIDYTSAFANLQSPVDAFTQGLKGGAEIRQIQFARQQQEAALAQQQQQRADLVELSRNPTPQAIGALMIRYPGMSEQLKRASDVVGSAQQQAHVEHASQVYSAALSGRADIAEKLLTERATALRNSGNEQGAAGAEHFARLVHDNPDQAKTVIGMQLAASMGPDKFAETFGKLGAEQRAGELQGDLVRKGAADASAAESGADSAKSKAVSDAVDAKYADTTALLKLEGIRTDNQYKRDQTKIAYLNAQIARESNALQRQKLQLDLQKATTERDEKVRGRVADAESAASSIDNMLNTVDRILKNPSLDSVLGSIQGRMPAVLSDEAADAIANIETLGSQVFLSQIPSMKGTGNLSEKEGDKLQTSLQNLGRVQSRAQFEANLREVQRLGMKARTNISTRYGVKLPAPDTPDAPKVKAPSLPSGWTVTER